MSQPGTTSHAEAARVLRRAGYSEEFITEVLRSLPDPIDFDRDSLPLLRYGLSRDRLIDRLGGSP
jgi:CBS-domain-containing membrane protein